MIIDMTLNHWKSFETTTLHVQPFTLLIGSTASGKTNLVEALAIVSRTANGKNIREAFEGDKHMLPIRGNAEDTTFQPADYFSVNMTLHDEHIAYAYSITVEPSTYLLIAERLVALESTGDILNDKKVLIDTNVDNDDNEEEVGGLLQRIDRMVELSGLYTTLGRLADRLPEPLYTTISDLHHIYSYNPQPNCMRVPTPVSSVLHSDASNVAGFIAGLPLSEQQALETALSHYMARFHEPHITAVWSDVIESDTLNAVLYGREQWHPDATPLITDTRTMADGTLRCLAILTALLVHPRGSLIVFEHIEWGMNATRLTILLGIIRDIAHRRHLNVLLTASNPDIFAAIEQSELPSLNVIYRDPTTTSSTIVACNTIADVQKLLTSLSPEHTAARKAIRRSLLYHKRNILPH